MHHPERPPSRSLVLELDGRRLIIIFKNVRIVLHLVDAREFYTMALKLNSQAHLLAWITAIDVGPPTSYMARGIRGPDLINQTSRFVRDVGSFVRSYHENNPSWLSMLTSERITCPSLLVPRVSNRDLSFSASLGQLHACVCSRIASLLVR